MAILHFVTDGDEPARVIAAFRDALPPGSYLALSHGTADFHAGPAVGQATEIYDRATAPLVLRSHAQITEFFNGFDLAEPGLVQVPLWRPDRKPSGARDLKKIAIYGGIGRKADSTSAQLPT